MATARKKIKAPVKKAKTKRLDYYSGYYNDQQEPILHDHIGTTLDEVSEYFKAGDFDDAEIIFAVSPVFQITRPSAQLTPYNG